MSISNQAGSLTIFPLTGTLSNPMKGISLASTSPATLVFTDTGIPFDPRITFARSTAGRIYNSAGVVTSIADNVARANANQDYNPSTLAARGFLIEAGATNQIRNNTMVGASAPSTLPTNWTSAFTFDALTLTVGTPSTSAGIEYVDLRLNGTTTNARTNIPLAQFETTTQAAASSGQTWTASAYCALSAGSLTNVTSVGIQLSERGAAGGYLTDTTVLFVPTGSGLATQRQSATRALNNGSTNFVTSAIVLSYSSGVAIDITLRIGLPQLEQNAFATSVIKTSTAATARGADLPRVATLSTIGYNSTQGSLSGQVMFEGVGSSNTRRIASFNDGTTDNEIAIVMADGGSDLIRFLVTSGGVTQADISSTVTAVANTLYKWAISWNASSFRISVNGTAGTEDTSGTVPTVDRLTIGTDGAGANSVNGWVPGIMYYPVQLSQAQMNSITA